MSYEHILVEREEGVGILTLNRPDKLNAMNRKLAGELHDAVKEMDADDAIGCIVITGAGTRAFSAGGDIHEQREDDRRFTEEELVAIRPPRRGNYEIAASAKPTNGMINGLAYGGAAELARTIAGNSRAAVMGIKTLRLKQMTQSLEEQWAEERHFSTHVVRGAKAEEAFPEFIARHGRPLG